MEEEEGREDLVGREPNRIAFELGEREGILREQARLLLLGEGTRRCHSRPCLEREETVKISLVVQ